MRTLLVESSRGQIKIQQMAFVLVGLVILFAMVGLFYFSLRYQNLKKDVETLREQETLETVRKMSGSPELAFTAAGDCSACIDMDKVLLLKDRTSYNGFWRNVALLKVERTYPNYGGIECTKANYPECDSITLVDSDKDLVGERAFVSLCRYEEKEDYYRCDTGKIIMGFETIG